MNHKIEFHGLDPFDLPVSHRSRAYPGTDAVTLAFLILDPRTNQPITVRIAVPNSQALELAGQIATASTGTP